ncbi:uncharacterized protein CXorf49 homolog [Molossus nigricans]
MSTPEGHEGSVWGAGLDPEGGPQARTLGPTLGALPSSPGKGRVPEPASLEEEREVRGAGGPVLWGREGRPGSPADVEGHLLDYLGSEAATAILQQLTDRDDLRVRRNPSPESCESEVSASTVWADLQQQLQQQQQGPGGTGAVGGWRLPSSAAPARRRRPGGGRAWGNPRRGARGRWQGPVEHQPRRADGLVGPVGPPSDSESSDEFSAEQLLSLSTCRRGGGQAKRQGPQEPPRHSCTHSGEKFLPVQGSFLPSAPRPLASAGDRPAAGGLDVSWKKAQGGACGKAGSRPSYVPGAVAAAAAAAAAATAAAAAAAATATATATASASGLPKVTPGRKVAHEKKSPGGACKVAPWNTYPSWEHTASEAAPLEPATFPPLSGSPMLGRGKKYPLSPLGTKQPKGAGSGQRRVARRKRGSLPVMVEGTEPRRDPGPEVQAPPGDFFSWATFLPGVTLGRPLALAVAVAVAVAVAAAAVAAAAAAAAAATAPGT